MNQVGVFSDKDKCPARGHVTLPPDDVEDMTPIFRSFTCALCGRHFDRLHARRSINGRVRVFVPVHNVPLRAEETMT